MRREGKRGRGEEGRGRRKKLGGGLEEESAQDFIEMLESLWVVGDVMDLLVHSAKSCVTLVSRK